jgi:hypothetical protein
MRIAAAVGAAAIVVLGLTACSTEDQDNAQNKISEAVTSGQQALETAKQSAGNEGHLPLTGFSSSGRPGWRRLLHAGGARTLVR